MSAWPAILLRRRTGYLIKEYIVGNPPDRFALAWQQMVRE
jgi:hypothetical protein